MVLYGKHPRAVEFADRFEALTENDAFRRHLDGLRAFREGIDPIPNRDVHEEFLRKAGHDFAANDVLKPGNLIRNLFCSGPVREDYFALHGTIAARLVNGKGALSAEKVVVLYDTLDRIFGGGGSWPEVTRVEAVSGENYRSLLRVKKPVGSPLGILHRILQDSVKVKWGEDSAALSDVGYSALLFLSFIVGVRNGRTRLTADDCFEAAEAYLQLFEADLLRLPIVERHGASGYEL